MVKGIAEVGQLYDPTTGTLSAIPTSTLWEHVRFDRAILMLSADSQIQQLLIPTAFPKLTTKQKQSKLDALYAYQQALRDITTQPDPANIAWPTPPV